MVWSSSDHDIVSAWSCQDCVVILPSLWYGCIFVIGDHIIINAHLCSFMSISLSCLGYLKVPRYLLFKVISWSWLIIPRQSQVRDMVKACSWMLFHDQVFIQPHMYSLEEKQSMCSKNIILKTWLLLDNQSTVGVIGNGDLLTKNH